MGFQQQRHQPTVPLSRPRELVVAVPAMRSQVNLARILRAAGCSGITQVIAGEPAKVDATIARDAVDFIQLRTHRSLLPVIKRLQQQGFRIVALEQASGAVSIYEYQFPRRCVLLVGHERTGVADELLAVAQDAIQIPVYGQPDSHNAATAAAIAMYEYCRQFPEG